MLNTKINNKSKIKTIYEQRYKDLNRSQLELLLNQFSYNDILVYMPDAGYCR